MKTLGIQQRHFKNVANLVMTNAKQLLTMKLTDENKECRGDCGETKPVEEFYIIGGNRGSYCKPCHIIKVNSAVRNTQHKLKKKFKPEPVYKLRDNFGIFF